MTDYNPDDDIAEALARDGYDPDYDVRRSTPEEGRNLSRRGHRQDRQGRPGRTPVDDAVGRGYHPETGDDLITLGSHDEASRQMLTIVMPLWMAREVRDNLIIMINTVEQLVAAGRRENRAMSDGPDLASSRSTTSTPTSPMTLWSPILGLSRRWRFRI